MESYEFFFNLDHLIEQLNANTSTSLPWENLFLKCREESTFQNQMPDQVNTKSKLRKKVVICQILSQP